MSISMFPRVVSQRPVVAWIIAIGVQTLVALTKAFFSIRRGTDALLFVHVTSCMVRACEPGLRSCVLCVGCFVARTIEAQSWHRAQPPQVGAALSARVDADIIITKHFVRRHLGNSHGVKRPFGAKRTLAMHPANSSQLRVFDTAGPLVCALHQRLKCLVRLILTDKRHWFQWPWTLRRTSSLLLEAT